jgi:hypothetical protein
MKALALLCVVGCFDGHGIGQKEAAVVDGYDHSCSLRTLPPATTCGVPPEELPCCAVQTAAGEEQLDCCPLASVFVHRLCADGEPVCTEGGSYPDTCAGLVCPPKSWPCPDQNLCCNELGSLGPRGCTIDLVTYEGSCRTIAVPGNNLCVGVYRVHGRFVRVTLPDGASAPD